jgi:hypothetical protein
MKLKAFLLIAALAFAPASQAAYVTLQLDQLSAVFSQSSFGSTPIELRIAPTTELVRPDLLTVDTSADVTALFNLFPAPGKNLNLIFVDDITLCGTNDSIPSHPSHVLGACAEQNGPPPAGQGRNAFIDSTDAAITTGASGLSALPVSLGTDVVGAALGHLLMLQFAADPTGNLMSAAYTGGGTLTSDQAATMLSSPLVQTDANGTRFVEIDPIVVVASATTTDVPEPASISLFAAALMLMAWCTRAARRR